MNPTNSKDQLYLVGFAEALATPEVCFSLHATGARVAAFYRSETRTRFARLNFVEYHAVTAPEVYFRGSIQEMSSVDLPNLGYCLQLLAMMRRSWFCRAFLNTNISVSLEQPHVISPSTSGPNSRLL